MTRERITVEAVALLDDTGIDGLTMRKLADRLGTGSTTLYWHIDTKTDVLDLALDSVIGEVPLAAPGPSWRDDLFVCAAAWRTTFLRHPWTSRLLGRPAAGPNALRLIEYIAAALTGAGLGEQEVAAGTWALHSHVLGAAAAEVSLPSDPGSKAAAREHLAALADTFPVSTANLYVFHDGDWTPAFLLGLEFLLDGIATRAT